MFAGATWISPDEFTKVAPPTLTMENGILDILSYALNIFSKFVEITKSVTSLSAKTSAVRLSTLPTCTFWLSKNVIVLS